MRALVADWAPAPLSVPGGTLSQRSRGRGPLVSSKYERTRPWQVSLRAMSQAPVPRVPSVLRGAPLRKTNFMEEFQKSYLRAIAASSGCIVASFEVDDGIDAQLNHKSDRHTHEPDGTARLELQLKATHSPLKGDHISATMSQKRFRYYRTLAPTVHKIVIVMHLPPDQADWIKASEHSLNIHHCAYWINLVDHPDSKAENPTVNALRANIFDDEALCGIMQRIGQGGRP